MSDYVLGKDAKAYFAASANAALAAMTEMDNIQDATCDMSKSEIIISSRAGSGWELTAAGLKKAAIDFKMLWKPGDTAFDAIQANWDSGAALSMAFLDGGKAVVGSQGMHGNFQVTNFKRNEPIDGPITVDVTVKMSSVITGGTGWTKVAA